MQCTLCNDNFLNVKKQPIWAIGSTFLHTKDMTTLLIIFNRNIFIYSFKQSLKTSRFSIARNNKSFPNRAYCVSSANYLGTAGLLDILEVITSSKNTPLAKHSNKQRNSSISAYSIQILDSVCLSIYILTYTSVELFYIIANDELPIVTDIF